MSRSPRKVWSVSCSLCSARETARRDPRTVERFLDRYDHDTRATILGLCDRWLAKHGSWEEKHGELR